MISAQEFNRGVDALRALPRKYIPVPTWNGKTWVPVTYNNPKGIGTEGKWPEGFDPSRLGEPRFTIGDRVIHRDWTGQPRIGTVVRVTRLGGYVHGLQSIEEAIRERYFCQSKYVVQFDGDYSVPAIWEGDLEQ